MKKKKDIQDELKGLSPFLSEKMEGRTGGFKTPEGYFARFSDRLEKRLENATDGKEELRELSPLLAKYLQQRKGGMKPPPGYFDSLADRVEEAAPSPAKVRGIGRRAWPKRLAAASVLLFAVAAAWWLSPKGGQDQISELEGYNEQQVLEYLDQNASEFDFGALLESGLISGADIDYQDAFQLSEEDRDLYINTILDEDG